MKPAGAVLVLLGGFAVFWEFSATQRRQLAMIRDLAAALNQLAGEIRWKLLPVPDAMGHLCIRKLSGKVFSKVCRSMESGTALQDAWKLGIHGLSDEIVEIASSIEWGGDMEQQEKSILYAARQMTKLGESKRESLRQREKLCAAATLSAAGLLVLILI